MSMFQRRHYTAVAKVLHDCYLGLEYTNSEAEHRMSLIVTMNKFVWMFSEDNPNFDAVKFREACNMQ